MASLKAPRFQEIKTLYQQETRTVLPGEFPLERMSNALVKEAFDRVIAAMAAVVFLPILAVIALLIRLDSPGPVLYIAIRRGRLGNVFTCYKFRTMYYGAATDRTAMPGDARITRVGRFLRRTSLDELPQLINVLRGEMSLIGPRPHRLDLDQKFERSNDSYAFRRFVKPGITGWAQVNGYRGPAENMEAMQGRVRYDLEYIYNWSLMLDLKILFLTVFGRKVRQNAH
ncbi:MAG: lipid carrier--UDP-N-acetylgalactosaminyltransferase [Bacteroidetes bacterium]|jgi:lipopolysaccharide/colanic/teichoic acid biosynthesis glycosyltransferase|nr:MAG: lipid carrier--UDP-N-acetylgalactosaminyltransferase [Bacteroidota bacterium]